MDEALVDLQKLLSKQIELYNGLHDILIDESEIINTQQLDRMYANNKQKEVAILEIKILEESCAQLIEKLCSMLPEPYGPPTLEHIVNVLPQQSGRGIHNVYTKLLTSVHSVRQLNDRNESMIKGALRAIKSSISFLTSCATAGASCYESRGQLRTEAMVMPLFEREA